MAPRSSLAAAIAILGFTVACSTQAPDVEVEKVPVGTDVQLTRQDGGVVAGKLTDKTESTVKVSTGKVTKEVPRKEIADVRVVDETTPVELPPIARFREFTVPADTALRLSIDTPLSSETAKIEDPVEATLANAVMIDGVEVLPAGSIVRGTVTAVEASGKVKGRASLALQFTTLVVRDERVPMSARWSAQAESTKKSDAKKIGIGAGAGALIGGLIGGGKGAATGAAVGGGAGTAMVLTSEGKPVALSKGEGISTALANAIDVKVPIK